MSPELAALVDSRALQPLLWPWPGTQLWLARLLAADLQREDRLRCDESARAARFLFETDRRRYRAAHVALSAVLEDSNAEAARRPFETGDQGKPVLAGGEMPHFNLSHSGDWALIGTSAQQAIGVDIEAARELNDMLDLAQRLFTPAERVELERLQGLARQRGFFHAWTRKEACVKAAGTGLSTDVSRLDTGLSPGPCTLDLEHEGRIYRIQVDSFDVAPRLVVAVALVVEDTGASTTALSQSPFT